MPSSQIRFNDGHLVQLASKARSADSRSGWVWKKPGTSDSGGRWQKRWLQLYQNYLFYFESDKAPRPLGVVLLELCECRRVFRRLQDAPLGVSVFSVGVDEPHQRQYLFAVQDTDSCNQWVVDINESKMECKLSELDSLREQCSRLQRDLAASEAENTKITVQYQQQERELQRVRNEFHSKRRSGLESPEKVRLARTRGRVLTVTPLEDCDRNLTKQLSTSSNDHCHPQLTNRDAAAMRIQQWYRRKVRIAKFQRLVDQYMASDEAAKSRQRNKTIWRFVANEESYVEQLQKLVHSYLPVMTMIAHSPHHPVTMETVNVIFLNIEKLLLLHELFLTILHDHMKKWPVLQFGEVLDWMFPRIHMHYHERQRFLKNSTQAICELSREDGDFIDSCLKHVDHSLSLQALMELTQAPSRQIEFYTESIMDLLSQTIPMHVDHSSLQLCISILKQLADSCQMEMCALEQIQRTCNVEKRIIGGCNLLLAPHEVLLRHATLTLRKLDISDKEKATPPKEYLCYLFSHHLIVATCTKEKVGGCDLQLNKDFGVLPLHGSDVSPVSEELASSLETHVKLSFLIQSEVDGCPVLICVICSLPSDREAWFNESNRAVSRTSSFTSRLSVMDSVDEDTDYGFQLVDASELDPDGLLGEIHCASLDDLLRKLITPGDLPPASYWSFVDVFFTTHSAFTTSEAVLAFLAQQYEELATETICESKPLQAIEREKEFLRRRRSGHMWSQKMLRNSAALSYIEKSGSSKKNKRLLSSDGLVHTAGPSLMKFAKYLPRQKRKLQKLRSTSYCSVPVMSPPRQPPQKSFTSYVEDEKVDVQPLRLKVENCLDADSRSKSSELLFRHVDESDEDLLDTRRREAQSDDGGLSDGGAFLGMPVETEENYSRMVQSMPMHMNFATNLNGRLQDDIFDDGDLSSGDSDRSPSPSQTRRFSRTSPTSDSGNSTAQGHGSNGSLLDEADTGSPVDCGKLDDASSPGGEDSMGSKRLSVSSCDSGAAQSVSDEKTSSAEHQSSAERVNSLRESAGEQASSGKRIVAIFSVLQYWVKHHSRDFNTFPELLQQLLEFWQRASCRMDASREEMDALRKLRKTLDAQREAAFLNSIEALQQHITIKPAWEKSHILQTADAYAIAEQMTLVDHRLVAAVSNCELLRKESSKKNLKPVRDRLTEMSDFVAYDILQGKNVSARVCAFEKWLSVAEHCLDLRNYPGFLQTMFGLQHTAVSRLHRTADQLSTKANAKLKRLQEFCSLSNNHAPIRTAMKQCLPPAVPYLGIIEKQITCSTNFKTFYSDGSVNFDKMKALAATLSKMRTLQEEPYPIPANYHVLSFLLNVSAPDAIKLTTIASRIEPRKQQ